MSDPHKKTAPARRRRGPRKRRNLIFPPTSTAVRGRLLRTGGHQSTPLGPFKAKSSAASTRRASVRRAHRTTSLLGSDALASAGH